MPAIDRARVATALPRYILGEQLGAGSFGLVLAGRHLDLERDVAVKVLPTGERADGSPLAAAFRAEARMLSRLDHPHIVRIYEYVGQDDVCLLIMELLGGGTLGQHRLPAEAACAVGLAVADALAHAHAHGVLHRDIKPDNILFTVTGQPKLTDFGIGRMFEGASGTTQHLAGTPRYMAPEQVTGGRVGPAADQYALGVVLYELLSGRPPFDSRLPVPELLRHHLEEIPPPLTRVPAPLADVVMTALAKAPEDRHPDAAAFGRALGLAAAVAYGPDWLARTGLLVRLQEAAFPDRPRRPDPDSGGHVFRPATAPRGARSAPGAAGPPLDPASPGVSPADGTPADLASPQVTPPHAGLGGYLPAGDQPRTGGDRPAEVGTDLPTVTGLVGGTDPSAGAVGAGRAAGVAGVAGTGDGELASKDAPGDDSHPFAGTSFGVRRFGWGRLRHRRAIVAAIGVLVAVALAVTGVVLATAGSGAKPGDTPAEVTASATGRPGADDGPGDLAIPRQFSGWAAGPGGVLYLSDEASNRVMRRDRDGKVRLVAGTGAPQSSGDGGPATAASLRGPTGLALDAKGNLYILDGHNGSGRVRRVDTAGTITTVAGGPDPGLVARPTGPVPATSTSFNSLFEDVAVDTNGDLYFADTSLVYKVDTAGVLTHVARVGQPSTITPLPGTVDPDAGLPRLLDNYLGGLAVRDGRIYAADDGANIIKVLDPDGRTVRTVAGTGQKGYSGDGGPATTASLDLGSLVVFKTSTLALDAAGNLYIADAGNYRVRRVDPQGVITTVAGGRYGGSPADGRPAVQQPLLGPDRVAPADDGSLYIDNSIEILRVDPQGILTTVTRD